MTSSRHRGRVRRPLSRLSRFFKEHRDDWWETAAFERQQHVTVSGSQWTIVYKIHALRLSAAHPERLEFRSSVTIWSDGLRQRPRVPGGRERAAVSQWRLWLQRELRRHGYRGRWETSPELFGTFWKTLPGAAAVPAEVKRLERLRL